ncbi:MAG: 50S ribosomal protein L23 [Luteitalea sp.]|nr:50S ribosomal protein L23 [Luteitalea sp.]
MKLTEVIRRPIVTEKTTRLRETAPIMVLAVAREATKVEIRQAVERLLGARVAEVRTVRLQGKIKRQGRFAGRRPAWKKAYVRLRDNEQMPDFLEGA